jgi:thioredoxin 1
MGLTSILAAVVLSAIPSTFPLAPTHFPARPAAVAPSETAADAAVFGMTLDDVAAVRKKYGWKMSLPSCGMDWCVTHPRTLLWTELKPDEKPDRGGIVERVVERPRLLWFHAAWCAPCRLMEAIIERLRARGHRVEFIDFDTQRDVAAKYGVTSLPTTIIVRGATMRRVVGVATEATLEGLLQ